MARPRTVQRWEHPTNRWCYVRKFRGGAATVVYGSYPKQTGLKFVPAARPEAMIILQRELDEYNLQQSGVIAKALIPTVGEEQVITIKKLFDDFLTCSRKVSDPRKKRIAKEMGHTPLNELASNTTAITSYVLQSLEASGNSTNTQRFSLKAIRQVFGFGVDRGLIRVNPIPLDIIPDEDLEDPTPYTINEIRRIQKDLFDGGRREAYLRCLIASGCRPVEAIRLRWPDVFPDYCILYSYKGRKRVQKRIVPYALCPGVKTAIDMMRSAEGAKRIDPVFQWNNYQNVADAVRECLGEKNLGLKAIRPWRINVWKRLGWPEDVRHAIAGHSKEIAEKHYETRWTAGELTSLVARNLQVT